MISVTALLQQAAKENVLKLQPGAWDAFWKAFCSHVGMRMLDGVGINAPGFFTVVPKNKLRASGQPCFWFDSFLCSQFTIRAGFPQPAPAFAPTADWGAVTALCPSAQLNRSECHGIIRELRTRIGRAVSSGSGVDMDLGCCHVTIRDGRYTVRFADQLLGDAVPTAAVPESYVDQDRHASSLPPLSDTRGSAQSVAGGSMKSPIEIAAERRMRKQRLKRLHHKVRANEYFASWSEQIAAKQSAVERAAESDRRNLEVQQRYAEEEKVRVKEAEDLRHRQALHVASMNQRLVVERASAMQPALHPMGDVFLGREEPIQERPDHAFLLQQMEEKRQREREESIRNDDAPPRIDLASERKNALIAKREAAKAVKVTYDAQMARQKEQKSKLTKTSDTELNYFFRNQTTEMMKQSERDEQHALRMKAKALHDRNARDLAEQRRVKRQLQADDARRERALYATSKAVDDEKALREALKRQRDRLDLLDSWKGSVEHKEAQDRAQKEMFKGWADQLPYKNDSSDSELDIDELEARYAAAERRKAAAARK